MANHKSLSEIKPVKLDDIANGLTGSASAEAGVQLARDAASFGIGVKDYLQLAVGREENRADGLDGYQQLLVKLNLPVKDDFANGIHLQAASDTFQTHPGTRALFPEVIDDVIRYANRQDNFEKVEPLLANSRTINGTELLSTVIEDDEDARGTYSISELGNIPVRTIRTSQTSVTIYKHGSGIRTSYEFGRRASIDLFIPHANRVARDLEISKVLAATSILINGDGVNGAATVIPQSGYNTATGFTAADGKINWPHFLKWIVSRAENRTPIDTIAMNWDGMFQYMMMFGANAQGSAGTTFGPTPVESLAKVGMDLSNMGQAMGLFQRITPVLSSGVPAGKLLGFSKGDTLEELREAGSDISETERAIKNQSMTMVKTENTGYKLAYGDTRSIFQFDE